MQRTLLILRHAKSAWDSDVPSDFDRPLNRRGRRDAPRVGAWLRDHGPMPDRVMSSTALRARQTTQAVAAELQIVAADIVWEQRIYEADMGDLLSVLADCPDTLPSLLLVGHNPGLESLVNYLCGLAGSQAQGLTTANLAWLTFNARWPQLDPGVATLQDLIRPRDL